MFSNFRISCVCNLESTMDQTASLTFPFLTFQELSALPASKPGSAAPVIVSWKLQVLLAFPLTSWICIQQNFRKLSGLLETVVFWSLAIYSSLRNLFQLSQVFYFFPFWKENISLNFRYMWRTLLSFCLFTIRNGIFLFVPVYLLQEYGSGTLVCVRSHTVCRVFIYLFTIYLFSLQHGGLSMGSGSAFVRSL